MTLNGPSHALKPFALRTHNLRLLPVACVAALCLAATAQFPNPKTELDRFSSEPYQGYPTASMLASINDVQAGQAYVAAAGETVAYFGEDSNYIRLITGVPSAIVFNNPADFTDSSAAYATGCAYVNSTNAKWLILSDEAIDIMGTDICGGNYEIVQIPGVRPGHAVERI
jgi:hypothetical protein